MKERTLRRIKKTFCVLALGFLTIVLVIVTNMALHMAGVIDLNRAIDNMSYAAESKIEQVRDDLNEKIEEQDKKAELKKEYKTKLKELKEEYGM